MSTLAYFGTTMGIGADLLIDRPHVAEGLRRRRPGGGLKRSIGLHDVITTTRIEMKLDEQMVHIHSAYAMFERARMDGLVPDEIYREECASVDLMNVLYQCTVPDPFHELEYSDKNGSSVLLTGDVYRSAIEFLGRTIWHSYEGEFDGPIGLPQVEDHCDESNPT